MAQVCSTTRCCDEHQPSRCLVRAAVRLVPISPVACTIRGFGARKRTYELLPELPAACLAEYSDSVLIRFEQRASHESPFVLLGLQLDAE